MMKILGIGVLILVMVVLFSPAASIYLAVKMIEVLIGWLVANLICKIIFKRTLNEILFDD